MAISLGSSACSLIAVPKTIPIEIPERPVSFECPAFPEVVGTIEEDKVILELESAERLKNWIHDYIPCMDITVIMLEAHIEKLENRLKAIP